MNAVLKDGARLGQHVASFAGDATVQLDLLAPTFSAALSHECRCLFIADRTPPDAVVEGLKARGCDIERPLTTEQFLLLTSDQTYIKGGYFDPERQLGIWSEAMTSARKAGYAGLCVSGEATWVSRGLPGVDRWLEYEFRLNLIEDRDFVGIICLYGKGSLPEWAEAELVKSHPFIHRNGQVKPSATFAGEEGQVADVPLLEELEPPADQLPCEMLAVLLSAHTDGALHPRRAAEVARHLEQCPSCGDAASSYQRFKGALAGFRAPSEIPEGFWEEFRGRLARKPDQS